MALFSAFSPLAGGDLSTYYRDNEYPYDLNGALDYTRPATLQPAYYPTIPQIGYVQGLLPLFTSLSLESLYGKLPYGIWTGQVPNNSQLQTIFPNMGGGLRKVGG